MEPETDQQESARAETPTSASEEVGSDGYSHGSKVGEAVANLNDGLAVYRPDGCLEFCNESFRLVNGYKNSDLKFGTTTYDQLGKLDEQSSTVDHKPFTFEERVAQLRRDGGHKAIQKYKGRIYERHQSVTPTGGIISLIRDITEHHRLEIIQRGRSTVLELLAKGNPLSDILKTLVLNGETLFQDMLGSVLLLDDAGTHLTVGAAPSLPPAYNDMCEGLEIGDGVGSCGTAAFIKERVIVSDISTHEYWGDFREIPTLFGLMACWSQPIISSNGKVLGTFAMYYREVREPTDEQLGYIEEAANLAGIAIEAHKRERALIAAVSKAEKATQAKSEFLATMSHELRTPLNAILGFSDMLRGDYLGPLKAEKYQDYATDIHKSGRHLLALIDDVLDISEIEAGKRSIEKTEVNFEDVLKECFRNFVHQAANGDIKLSSSVAANLPVVRADHRCLTQIVLNLVSNAIKFSPPGGKVHASVVQNENVVELIIEDTGYGMPAEVLSGITEPFAQGHSNPLIAQKGTGLGLSIVKLLVEAHDGELKITSQIDVGTTVTASFPVEP